ncbi:rhodanese-like domain-containing protein 4A, chloroplastic [Lotus japonicus]|uniref:rhodanese-like domain-containing protein 4A, chloroplastic n=1 Tax=Lotus japonicus TaxID=34305 RepID=UPI002582F2AD|nr:rhodanese-like domain-containing protein 4A, chloroplastic [Lotus japonicus]
MDSLSILLSSYPLCNQNHFKTHKPFSPLSNHTPHHSATQPLASSSSTKKNLFKNPILSLSLINLFTPFPSLAVEPSAPTLVDSEAGKISLETVLVTIDDFFNRYPFFVAGCTFIWLIAIPLAEEYFKKCKFVSAIDAFRKLRDDPDSQLLDIRDGKSVRFLASPNLKMLKKEVVQVEFSEGNEDGFVRKVLERFKDAPNTVVCVLDSFDGNSMKAAELLFKNGFKEAYAIKGGVRGQQGWMAIQDTLLPPSLHMYRRKKTKASQKLSTNGNGAIQKNDSKNESSLSLEVPTVENQKTENGHVKRSVESGPEMRTGSRASSSPYPNYPDLKPPSSPTPSKPQ